MLLDFSAGRIALVLVWTVLAAALWVGCTATRAGYASPRYQILERRGDVEIREYPSMVLARTPGAMAGEESGKGFMRLFRFITGANESGAKIAMTTPVLLGKDESGVEHMNFVMPENLTQSTVPKPKDAAVSIESLPARTFAVLRIRRLRSEADRSAGVERVRAALEGSSWKPVGRPQFAGYDPPWIPVVFCRNEVWVRVER